MSRALPRRLVTLQTPSHPSIASTSQLAPFLSTRAHSSPPTPTRRFHRFASTKPRRAAAVAFASTSPQATSSSHDSYDDAEVSGDAGFLSDIAREELERALYPAWDDMTTPSVWDEDAYHRQAASAAHEQVEHSEGAGEWREWMEELREESIGKGKGKATLDRRPSPTPFNPPPAPTPPPPVDAAPQVIVESTRPKAQPLLVEKPIIHSVLGPEALAASSISPYVPPTSSRPDAALNQPHQNLLLSRNDWRLSSPRRRRRSASEAVPTEPPSLYSHAKNTLQGHNKLLGVGVEPVRSGQWTGGLRGEEPWGWKVKVPSGERGEWVAADVHRKRLDRLLDLTQEADEKSYLETLARSGTPYERERQGRTVCRALGQWLTDAARAEHVAQLGKEEKAALAKGRGKAVAAWRSSDDRGLGQEDGYQFEPGTILRFTPLTAADFGTGPRPPATSAPKHPQGTLLEVREGQLIVSFEEVDMWVIGDREYRIDVGNDETSLYFQRLAIDNLYFDPARQSRRNMEHVHGAQAAFKQGSSSILREWTLQGTNVRELIVPDLDTATAAAALRASAVAAQDEVDERDLFDDSPASEIAHLPSPISVLPVVPRPNEALAVHPSSLFADNQLINSWIKRHQRDNPMSMTGDPVLNLNASQTKAVAMALGERLSLIQGPPGTGKSQTIVAIIALLKLHFRIPQPILLAAPTHVSVDHLLSLLIKAGLNPFRTGKASKVRPELQAWTLEKRRESHPLWDRLEAAREESEKARLTLQEFRDRRPLLPAGKKSKQDVVQMELNLENLYRKAWRKFISLEQRLHSSLFATADVFCSTAMGSGSSKVLSMVDFPIVFLDEAAMCTEPVTLIPLMKGAEHVTFIGDHKQLPAVVKSRPAVRERLHVSLFERLMVEQSVKTVLLDTQYRMRPAISAFPNQAFYHSALEDSTTVSARPPPPSSAYLPSPDFPSVFISHSHPESTYRQSTLNRAEAEVIVDVVGDLLLRNPSLLASDIGIISPYYAQTQHLLDVFNNGAASDRLAPLLGWDRADHATEVEVNTVDGFQGREKRIIILSTVRSNAAGHIGFLTDQRRLNVALTRAQDALFVVGNQETLRRATSSGMGEWSGAGDVDADAGVWRRFLNWMDERGAVKQWQQEATETT